MCVLLLEAHAQTSRLLIPDREEWKEPWLERLVFPPVAGGGSVKHLLLSELVLPRG